MPVQSAFTLTANEIYDTLANMIISQEVFADNLGEHQTLVDKARVDGGLYGDTKLYYATDVLKSHVWSNDSEASNLLSLDRAADPDVQAIKLDKFRQIRLTVDNYLTKQAFADEGAFSSFNSVMLGWLRETKRVYDGTLYNAYIGTAASSTGKQTKSIDLGTGSGCISIALKKENDNLSITSTDISKKALKVAKNNAKMNDVSINFINTNIYDGINDKFDIIISNPPYIKEEEEIMDIVYNNEPHIALYGGKDGLYFYKEILKNITKVIKEKYLIAFEIGETQAKEIEYLVNIYLPKSTVIVKKDMQNRDRMIFIHNFE